MQSPIFYLYYIIDAYMFFVNVKLNPPSFKENGETFQGGECFL